jgi:hypothetical protein
MNTILLFGMPGSTEITILALFFGIAILTLLIPILAIVDIVRSQFKAENDKLIWIIVVVFLPLVGSLLYFSMGRAQRLVQ